MKFLFVTIVPMLPLTGYACSGAEPFSFYMDSDPSRLPHPRFATGSPAVPSMNDEGRRGPSPFGDRAIRERAAKWTVKRLEVPRWRILVADHFTIRSDALLGDLRYAAVVLEEAHAILRSLLGGDPTDIQFSVRLFRSYEEFHVYAACTGVPEAESFYNPKTYEVVVYTDPEAPRAKLIAALLHEVTHIYMHRVFGRVGPLWLAEGLAEYMGRCETSEDGLSVGAVDAATLRELKGSLERGGWIPLAKLLDFDRDRFYGGESAQAYAESWLLAHYLLSRRRDAHDDPVRACLAGADLHDIADPAALEREVKEYLATLQ